MFRVASANLGASRLASSRLSFIVTLSSLTQLNNLQFNINPFAIKMDNTSDELNKLFAPPPTTELAPDILGELQSILRLHGISPQELFFKWESYSIKMGSEETKLDPTTARAFKKDVQENLERETRGKIHVRGTDKRSAGHAVARNPGGTEDVFGM